MNIETDLHARSQSQCEFCKTTDNLSVYLVPPANEETVDTSVLVCPTCLSQLQTPESVDANHWRCLNDAIWSEVPAVKVVAYRMLHGLRSHGWPQDLLDMMYLDEAELKWAQATLLADGEEAIIHKDCNGVVLATGNTVVLTKDLDVKGTSFAAKRGTAVRNIYLVPDNAEQIEGKVNGQQIVILTKYVKKS